MICKQNLQSCHHLQEPELRGVARRSAQSLGMGAAEPGRAREPFPLFPAVSWQEPGVFFLLRGISKGTLESIFKNGNKSQPYNHPSQQKFTLYKADGEMQIKGCVQSGVHWMFPHRVRSLLGHTCRPQQGALHPPPCSPLCHHSSPRWGCHGLGLALGSLASPGFGRVLQDRESNACICLTV